MDIIGIVVHVSQMVSPTTVPAEDRINDIIDGVLVQIQVDEWGGLGDEMGLPNDEHRPLVSEMRGENGMVTPTKGSA